jgi:hypothetical protein
VVVIVLVVLGLGVMFLALRPDSTSPEDDDPTENLRTRTTGAY